MLAFFLNIVLALSGETAGGAARSESAWTTFVHFWNDYANYPGFELWKFVNLAIFIGVMYYILKKPLSEVFIAKREAVRADLIRAEEEKRAANLKLAAADEKIARLESETKAVIEKAKKEAEDEKKRIASQTGAAIAKLKEQAAFQIDRKRKQVEMELRRFSAEECIRLAEEKIKGSLDTARDTELVKAGIKSIGGMI